MKEYLFSYGTLQREDLQFELFGRRLNGERDTLRGFRISILEIGDVAFLKKGEDPIQRIAFRSDSQNDSVKGAVYEVSEEELLVADKYEPEGYKRLKIMLESGKKAWVYMVA